MHDFLIPELGRATPYGIYDLAQNTGWVSVGVDHDTDSIRGGKHSAVVAVDGAAGISEGQSAVDHRRCRRQ